jgi:putative ABC transport system permease protein
VQVLAESVALSILGGLVGILLGVGGSGVISRVAGWPTFISSASIVVAVFVSSFVGVGFGLYPARKAASLSPIDALRYE